MRGLPTSLVALLATGSMAIAHAAPGGPIFGVRGAHPPIHPGQMAHRLAGAKAPTTSGPVFTFIDFPGASYTNTGCIDIGAKANAKRYVTGAYGPGIVGGSGSVGGFFSKLTTKNGVMTESFSPIMPAESDVWVECVNDAGTIVGNVGVPNPQGFIQPLNGSPTALNVPYSGAVGTIPYSINNSGTVVGYWFTANQATGYGFTWKNGVFTQIPSYPGTSYTQAAGINSAGDIVGLLVDSGGVTHGFLLQGSTYTLIDPPGSGYSIANGINDAGEIAGEYCASAPNCSDSGTWYGFTYIAGAYSTFAIPGVPITSLNGVNDAGEVVGVYVDTNGLEHGFLATP
jgi:uncharacterized membrane protein